MVQILHFLSKQAMRSQHLRTSGVARHAHGARGAHVQERGKELIDMQEPQMNRAQRREQQKMAKRKKPQAGRRFDSMQDAYAHLLKPIALLNDCRPYRETEVAHDMLRIRAAFERLKDGTADQDDFNRVAVAFNLAKIRAIEIDETLADELEKSQDAMMRCKERYKKHGRFGFDGEGLQACEYAIEAHEAILVESSPKQMENAMFAAHKAVKLQTKQGQQLAQLLG